MLRDLSNATRLKLDTITRVVKLEYTRAAAQFAKTRGANWGQLETAMHAVQGLSRLTEEQVKHLHDDVPVVRITETAADWNRERA